LIMSSILVLNSSPQYDIDFLTYLATHVESDSTIGGKFAGGVMLHDLLVHDTIFRCQ